MITGLFILAAIIGIGAVFALFAALIGVAVAGGALAKLRDMLTRHRKE
ncbi:hypothetical protein Rhe02_22310 [Rhizocola hellebori]|uniref:Uncharacterized protein n=1 Tax=Rhizocola hellebori TaxID=1392758 RepID=A0A8J3VE36_9ACTN|nr:hypothetical protein [Rhizocola hellebori]GIH04164.1 hypothetical protein Rhe02_22310 [Rhizocola hellebori]